MHQQAKQDGGGLRSPTLAFFADGFVRAINDESLFTGLFPLALDKGLSPCVLHKNAHCTHASPRLPADGRVIHNTIGAATLDTWQLIDAFKASWLN